MEVLYEIIPLSYVKSSFHLHKGPKPAGSQRNMVKPHHLFLENARWLRKRSSVISQSFDHVFLSVISGISLMGMRCSFSQSMSFFLIYKVFGPK